MRPLYPEIEPYACGMLEASHANRVYWETCGTPEGKPALVLHGGPGSGCTAWHRRLFDPAAYRIVLFDQRGCGRSTPHASLHDTSLDGNTTPHLIADIEALRKLLSIERWLVWGGSFGSELALAYAQQHPSRVTEMVVWGIATGRRSEADWLFRGGVGEFFPEQWQRLLDGLPAGERSGDPVAGYRRLLNDPDPAIRRKAAADWCLWESATPDWPPRPGLAERYTDPAFALAFARLVTHYVHHDLWIEDGSLLRGAGALANVPGILIQGRFDLQSPLGSAWALQRAWPGCELVVVGNAGHSPGHEAMRDALVAATDRLAIT
ncbi:MAG: proline iminopeptidase [Gaiellales bacterium]|nr:proline iminopeptidase [Gaiellales bacterium]